MRRPGEPWRSPSGQGYDREAELQLLLAEHPELIPGVPQDAMVCRELYSSAGFADLVAVAPDGSITLVECKLDANPQVRREVVAQALDYASRMWRMSIDEFERAWAAAGGPDLFVGDPDLRAVVAANLAGAQFRLVLAVDTINDELRRIVEFLSRVTVSGTTVVAVEYLRYFESDVELLFPRAFGEELAQAARPTTQWANYSGRQRWTVGDVLAWSKEHDPDSVGVLEALLEAWRDGEWTVAGGRAEDPSLNISMATREGSIRYPFIIYTHPVHGARLEVRFGDLKNEPGLAWAFARAITEIWDGGPTFSELVDAGFAKRPKIGCASLAPEQATQLVERARVALAASSWLFDERALGEVSSSSEWRAWQQQVGDVGDARDVLMSQLDLQGRSWPDAESCREHILNNHAGGLPVSVAEAVVLACAPHN